MVLLLAKDLDIKFKKETAYGEYTAKKTQTGQNTEGLTNASSYENFILPVEMVNNAGK